jgi:hypothetical protein
LACIAAGTSNWLKTPPGFLVYEFDILYIVCGTSVRALPLVKMNFHATRLHILNDFISSSECRVCTADVNYFTTCFLHQCSDDCFVAIALVALMLMFLVLYSTTSLAFIGVVNLSRFCY